MQEPKVPNVFVYLVLASLGKDLAKGISLGLMV